MVNPRLRISHFKTRERTEISEPLKTRLGIYVFLRVSKTYLQLLALTLDEC